MKRLHICILTTAHPIDDVRVNEKFARSFLSSGFRVSWAGPAHAYVDKQPALATGIEFHLASENRSKLDRLFSFVSVYRKANRVADVDIYYCPEPDSARLALRLAKRNHAKVILDLHEVYHGPMLTRWLGGLALPVIRELLRKSIAKTCRRCDLVLGVSAAVLDYYVSPSSRRLIVRSCAPAWFADMPPADVCGDGRKRFTIMHGKRSFARGTLAVLEAAALASRTAANLRIIIFDEVSTKTDREYPLFADALKRHRLEGIVDFRAGITLREMTVVLRDCDVGMIAYGMDFGHDVLPNRLFEFMAAGLPVLAPKYAREVMSIVDAEQCGMPVDFEDPADIERAMLYLWANSGVCRQMGKRGREAFCMRHNWEREFQPVLARIKSWEKQEYGDTQQPL